MTLGVSGINGVEWDAVELPSQFMENFCWEWDVLARMTRTSTAASRCRASCSTRCSRRRISSRGLQTVRQIEFALFDMRLHHDFDPAGAQTPAAASRRGARARSRWSCRRPTTASRTASRTSSPAATQRATTATSGPKCFRPTPTACSRRTGVLDPETGARFRDEILAVGGSRPAIESFKAFRGREPTIDALLRHNGMITA